MENPPPPAAAKAVKVLVWDLDHTLWDGILLEADEVRLRPGVLATLQELDRRGILMSIASRNEHGPAMAKLRELGVADFFLYPQIHWNDKAQSVETIARRINVGLDTVVFIDDQPFERDSVRHGLPQVRTLDAAEVDGLLERPELMPRFITAESAERRRMYQADIERNREEETFAGSQEEFLAGLGMRFTVARAREEDLQRAEELTVRTHQLNTTGYTYSYEELDAFRVSPRHLLLIANLDDRYGAYGKIGLVLIEKGEGIWTVRLLLMSCRVLSRGVGSILINHLLATARQAGVRLQAELKSTDRNRMMLVTYKFAGFKEISRDGDLALLEHDLAQIQPFPTYLQLDLSA